MEGAVGSFVGDRVHLCIRRGTWMGGSRVWPFVGTRHTPPRQRPCPHPTVVWSTTLRGSSAGLCTPTTSAARWLRPPGACRVPTLPFHLPLPRSCLAPAAAVVRRGARAARSFTSNDHPHWAVVHCGNRHIVPNGSLNFGLAARTEACR
jgi:hypothetical protein